MPKEGKSSKVGLLSQTTLSREKFDKAEKMGRSNELRQREGCIEEKCKNQTLLPSKMQKSDTPPVEINKKATPKQAPKMNGEIVNFF